MSGKFLTRQPGIQSDWLIDELQQRQVSLGGISRLLLDAGLQMKGQCFLPTEIYLTLFNWGAEQAKDPFLGIHIARTIDFRSFGMFGYLMQCAPTLGGVCHLIERYQAIFMRGMGFDFRQLDRECEVCWHYWVPSRVDARQDIEFSLGALVEYIRRNVNENWFPLRADFTYPGMQCESVLQEHFGSNCYFNQPYNRIVFESSVMNKTLEHGDAQLLALMEIQANKLITDIEQGYDFLKTVRLLITANIGSETFSHEQLANQLNIAGRTLRRRLKQYNVTYQQLRDEIMLEMAKKALLETSSSITALAQQVGYSEASAFVRSFKRLVGVSPRQYRSGI